MIFRKKIIMLNIPVLFLVFSVRVLWNFFAILTLLSHGEPSSVMSQLKSSVKNQDKPAHAILLTKVRLTAVNLSTW